MGTSGRLMQRETESSMEPESKQKPLLNILDRRGSRLKRCKLERYPIEIKRWYRVKPENELMSICPVGKGIYSVVDYYRRREQFSGSLLECKKFIYERLLSLNGDI